MARKGPLLDHLFLLAILLHVGISPHSAGAADSDVLLKFKDSIHNNTALSSWAPGSKPCTASRANWAGVRCSDDGSVWALQLEEMSLAGRPDIDVLMGLPGLRSLSFANNSFDGPMPSVGKLSKLKSVFLSGNRFSGDIPANAFEGMGMLKKVYLSQNEFSGRIPSSLVGLTRLFELGLEENRFTGRIPNFQQEGWKYMNMSYNELDGRIPVGLIKTDRSSFIGNKDLCGEPMGIICKKSKKLSTALLIAIIVIATAVSVAIIGTLFILLQKRGGSSKLGDIQSNKLKRVASYGGDQPDEALPNYVAVPEKKAKDYDQGSLVFVREDREKFELQDLLRASAQVLGNGSFGSTYKAVLLSGQAMAVKRYREMNGVGREGFQDHMRRLGRLSHPNLQPMVGFYYKKEEKLLVSDYAANGSLVQLLHGNRSESRRVLDWPTRLKIIKGVARGMAYLHNELSDLTLAHGHLKSSNVLLNEWFEPLLTDYALAPMLNKDAKQLMVAYQSPECVRYGNVLKKSDVWCLGILILEILTGKFPGNYNRQKAGGTDLASWVNSVVREEWTGEVFDGDMTGTKNGEGEMLKLLQVGLGCCEKDVDKRWGFVQAIERIEELKERETEEYSSFGSDADMYSSKDEFSFSMNIS